MNFFELEKLKIEQNDKILSSIPTEEEISGYIWVTGCNVLPYGNNKKRMVIKAIGKEEKQIEIVLFNPVQQLLDTILSGVIYIEGKWNCYEGKWNIVANKLECFNLQVSLSESDFFIKERNLSFYEEIYKQCKLKVTNPDLINLLNLLEEKYIEKYKIFPAGISMHDVGKGGLYKHTIKMLRTGLSLSSIYGGNFDIIMTSIMFHDLGKLVEIEPETLTYSLLGQMKGHALISYEEFINLATEINLSKELKLQIGHCIISHAGEMEYGAITKPATLEAYIVNLCDHIDSTLISFLENENPINISYNRAKKRPVISTEYLESYFNENKS